MKVSIIGSGSWGLAIGKLLYENGNEVTFWSPSAEEVELLSRDRVYEAKLPGIKLDAEIVFTTSMQEALTHTGVVVIAVPSQFFASTARLLQEHIGVAEPGVMVVSLTKGIERNTLLRMSEVLLKEAPALTEGQVAVLSGPSHAEEVARKILTSVVIASTNLETAEKLQLLFTTQTLRVYTSSDVVGVEMCGSLKNVVAIAAGILDGLKMGDNTKGALMTRGLAEISRLGEAMGAQIRTFLGLAGMGDLITTCISQHSRNRYVGEKVGQGLSLTDALKGMSMVAEGVPTCESAYALAKKTGIEMPITEAVYDVLFNGKDPMQAAMELMTRELKLESV
jgi:glycerol-3-phosphate dehydrogenase (NAD(P)+)